jgi:hypothetical protein
MDGRVAKRNSSGAQDTREPPSAETPSWTELDMVGGVRQVITSESRTVAGVETDPKTQTMEALVKP